MQQILTIITTLLCLVRLKFTSACVSSHEYVSRPATNKKQNKHWGRKLSHNNKVPKNCVKWINRIFKLETSGGRNSITCERIRYLFQIIHNYRKNYGHSLEAWSLHAKASDGRVIASVSVATEDQKWQPITRFGDVSTTWTCFKTGLSVVCFWSTDQSKSSCSLHG